MAELIQFVVSLIAILAIARFVAKLGLGGPVRIADDDHARQIAQATIYGFEPSEIAIDRSGSAALLRDADCRIMLIFTSGSHFAGRLLTSNSEVRLNQEIIEVTPADSAIGTIRLQLGRAAQDWAASLRRLNNSPGAAAEANHA